MPEPAARPLDRAATSAAEPQFVRRLERLAIGLGLCSIVAAAIIGWTAYSVSRKQLVESVRLDTLNHARACAEFFAGTRADLSEAEALSLLSKHFEEEERLFPDSYLCVLDRESRLLLHTLDPKRRGESVGDRIFDEEGERPPVPLRDLVVDLAPPEAPAPSDGASRTPSQAPERAPSRASGGEDRGRVGTLKALDGKDQLLACAYAPGRDALVAIHVPWASVDRHVNAATLPWALGLALTVLVAIPLAIWGLSRAYAAAERESRKARAAERRAAEQVRILREIDRAILAGGTVEEIVAAALQRLGKLIPYHRASVALLHEAEGVTRVLAVQSSAGTRIGVGTEVPLSELAGSGLAELRAGETVLMRDLDDSGADGAAGLPSFLGRLRAEGVRSMAKIPLSCRGELLGTLNLAFSTAGEPASADLELGREVADVIALAVLQAKLRSELEKQAADLERRVRERTHELSEVNVELEGYVRSVSHDLRAPLRAVHGFGNMLLEETGSKLGKTEREYLERIVSASGRMVALVRDLLDYSRLGREEVRVRALDLLHVVEESQDLLQSELDERRAKVEIRGPLLSVLGHHSSLVQAVVNLLSNGAKFVAPGVDPRIVVRTEPSGSRVRIWVEDNGIGIRPADQERVFRMFERLNVASEYPGTGIGLAIARRAVERMGGTMGVESTPGEGSRFWVDLPSPERNA